MDGYDSLGSGPESLSSMMMSLYIPNDDTESIRPEDAKFKGYSSRAYDPGAAGKLADVQVGSIEDPPIPCRITDRRVRPEDGVEPKLTPDDRNYNQVLKLASEYRRLSRTVTKDREEKILALAKLETAADNYLANTQDDEKKDFILDSIKNKINEERRLIFGIENPYGKIYFPEDETASKENFAHGNSASIALITYQGENRKLLHSKRCSKHQHPRK